VVGDLPYVSYSPSGNYNGINFLYPQLTMGFNNLLSRHTYEIDPRTKVLDFRSSINKNKK